MIVPDANLLLYAYDSSSPFHRRSVDWWKACLSGEERVGLCGPVIFAFLRVGTSSRAFTNPLTIGEAAEHVRTWLARPVTEYVVTEEADVARAMEWLEAQAAGGDLTTDAQIAAIAERHHATVHTADTDFSRFPGVRWHNPIL